MHRLEPSLKRVLLFDSDQLILKHFDNLFSDIPPVDLAAPAEVGRTGYGQRRQCSQAYSC